MAHKARTRRPSIRELIRRLEGRIALLPRADADAHLFTLRRMGCAILFAKGETIEQVRMNASGGGSLETTTIECAVRERVQLRRR